MVQNETIWIYQPALLVLVPPVFNLIFPSAAPDVKMIVSGELRITEVASKKATFIYSQSSQYDVPGLSCNLQWQHYSLFPRRVPSLN